MNEHNHVTLMGYALHPAHFELVRTENQADPVPYMRVTLWVPRDYSQMSHKQKGELEQFLTRLLIHGDDPASVSQALTDYLKAQQLTQPPAEVVKRKLPHDLIRIVRYGEWARVDTKAIDRKGCSVLVQGWLQSRQYMDRESKRRHTVTEVNSRLVVYRDLCNLEAANAEIRRITQNGDRDQLRNSSTTLLGTLNGAVVAELIDTLDE